MGCRAIPTLRTGVQSVLCDPHSPWHRGSNENTNSLVRQYLPKSTDLSVYSQAELARSDRFEPQQAITKASSISHPAEIYNDHVRLTKVSAGTIHRLCCA